jgi:hypothetical protein
MSAYRKILREVAAVDRGAQMIACAPTRACSRCASEVIVPADDLGPERCRNCGSHEWETVTHYVLGAPPELQEPEPERRVARIFEEGTGRYHICDDDSDFLDARGFGHPTKIAALRAAAYDGYTHATGSGTYWGNGVRSIAAWR